MENRKQNGTIKKNRVTVIESKWKELEKNLKNWLDIPPVIVEAAAAAVSIGVTGAFICLVLDTLSGQFCSDFPFLPPLKVVPVTRLIDPLHSESRNCRMAAGLKKDVKLRMAAGFGSGTLSSIVARDPLAHVVLSGVFFAKVSRKKTLRNEHVQYRMVVAFAAGILSSICRGDPPAKVILNGVFFVLVVAAVYQRYRIPAIAIGLLPLTRQRSLSHSAFCVYCVYRRGDILIYGTVVNPNFAGFVLIVDFISNPTGFELIKPHSICISESFEENNKFMEKGKQNGPEAIEVTVKKNRVTVIETKWKELERNLNNWLDKPPVVVEAAIAAVDKGVTGAFICLVLDTLAGRFCSAFPFLPPLKAVPVKRLIDPLYMGVLIGSDAGIRCFMKKTQGKKAVKSRKCRMAAGFGAGILSSIVARDPPAKVVLNGVGFALARAAVSKIDIMRALERGGVQSRLVFGFGVGILASVVRGDPPAHIVLNGAFFGLVGAAAFKAAENELKKQA
ncbi:hypothetical protein SSX86_022379 [Deinandra increscens subsp. villosa]|uniref:Uncharacterized protein n=1 Tax=Deinandra increscens subsp. villosa TaxID=3103831 RepID=A0AAP0CME2_9ASTR